MEPIIEIISKNIMNNKKYNRRLKNEYITTINRITSSKINIAQIYRSMDYSLLYNTLLEELTYLKKQKLYFSTFLDNEIKNILNDYFDSLIKSFEYHIKIM